MPVTLPPTILIVKTAKSVQLDFLSLLVVFTRGRLPRAPGGGGDAKAGIAAGPSTTDGDAKYLRLLNQDHFCGSRCRSGNPLCRQGRPALLD